MSHAVADAGSFRDPSGHIYDLNGEIYRTVLNKAVAEFIHVRDSGLAAKLMSKGKLVATEEVKNSTLKSAGIQAPMVLRHARIPFVSYPYEWSFPLLKAASDAASARAVGNATRPRDESAGPWLRRCRRGPAWSTSMT